MGSVSAGIGSIILRIAHTFWNEAQLCFAISYKSTKAEMKFYFFFTTYLNDAGRMEALPSRIIHSLQQNDVL